MSDQKIIYSNEELLIRELVEDIYQTQEKINSINNSLNKETNLNIIPEKISNLTAIKINLETKRNTISNKYLSETKNNDDQLKKLNNLLQETIKQLNICKKEIEQIDTTNFNSLILNQILSGNSNDFLSEYQINSIFNETKIMNSDNTQLKKMYREIKINKASESVIINNYNMLKEKINQIEENLKMMKEEKICIKNELTNFISCKETLDSIIKLNTPALNIHIKNNNNSKTNLTTNNNIWTKPAELFLYELQIINPHLVAINIANELFSIFNIKNFDNEENLKNNMSYALGKDACLKINNFNTLDQNLCYNKYTINHNKSISMNKIANQNKLLKNGSEIMINSGDDTSGSGNNNFNKKILTILIQNEINKFIKNDLYSFQTIQQFLENLSLIIISKFQSINIIISSEVLTIYLSYFFKSQYYDATINIKCKFINKEYKSTKKTYKKILQELSNKISKLDIKYNEYQSKTKIIENQINFIISQNNTINSSTLNINNNLKLSKIEQKYIQICCRANGLMKKKENLTQSLNEYKLKNKNLKRESENFLNKINIDLNNIISQIQLLNNDLTNKNNKAINDINKYTKLINEKYNIIKKQLQLYKMKHGTNLDIYDRLINSINETIKKNYNKPSILLFNTNMNSTNIKIRSKVLKDFLLYNDSDNQISFNKTNYSKTQDKTKLNKVLNNINGIFNSVNDNNFNECLFKKTEKNKSINYDLNYDVKEIKNKTFYNGKSPITTINKKRKNTCIINNAMYSSFLNDNICKKTNNNRANSNSVNIKHRQFTLNSNIRNKNIEDRTINNSNNDLNDTSFIKYGYNKLIKPGNNTINCSSEHTQKTITNFKKRSSNNDKNYFIKNKSCTNIFSSNINSKNKKFLRQNLSICNQSSISKINSLTEFTHCFYRYSNYDEEKNKYDPLINNDLNICEYPLNFIKGCIYVNSSYDKLLINSKNAEILQISIKNIENTFVNPRVKSIIEIHRCFRKYKESSKYISIEDFVKKHLKKYKDFSGIQIEKCALNQNFNFSLIIKGEKNLEIIICPYEKFKTWINGLAQLIKNKNEILKKGNGNL